MKAILFALLACTFMSASIFADDKAADDAKKKEMMEAWMKYATPGANHKVLEPIAGKWKYTSKFWEAPESKPQESGGTSTMKMILGGRFLQHDIKGKAMGMPFQGLGFTGYDNIKGTYESIWLDSMGTGLMHGTGSFDSATKTLKDSGEYTCPMSDDKKCKYRSEWKIVDKNNMLYTMWGPDPEGKEFKQMEMAFKRTK
ncbi:MAG: DUF1579 domain-containing protein [Bdellovibrionota bacterium]